MTFKLKTGVENLTKSDRTGRYTPFISWKDGDRKFLAFVTPANEIPEVLFHNFVKIPTGNDENPYRWGTFMCRKDPAWLEESNGECYLCDVLNHAPIKRYVAVAVELEPEFTERRVTGLSIKYKKKDDKEYPQVGLVIQSKKLFFSWLGAYNETREDITKVSFEVMRQGKNADNTKYMFFDIQNRPDLSAIEEFIPDLTETLKDMGSLEKYEEELKDVKAEDQPVYDDNTSTATASNNGSANNKEEFEKLSKELGLAAAK